MQEGINFLAPNSIHYSFKEHYLKNIGTLYVIIINRKVKFV